MKQYQFSYQRRLFISINNQSKNNPATALIFRVDLFGFWFFLVSIVFPMCSAKFLDGVRDERREYVGKVENVKVNWISSISLQKIKNLFMSLFISISWGWISFVIDKVDIGAFLHQKLSNSFFTISENKEWGVFFKKLSVFHSRKMFDLLKW